MLKPEDIKLGYLLITSPQPNIYIGGAMITDVRGLPIEFRYTEPIQPTKIQQILYGQVLSQYIKREVILETLMKNMESRFKCLLVEDEHLLNYPAKGYLLLRVAETKSAPLESVGKIQEMSPTEILFQASKEGSPLRIHLKEKETLSAPDGSTGTGEESRLPVLTEVLSLAGQSMDIYEPLKRIEKALEIICQEEGILSATKS